MTDSTTGTHGSSKFTDDSLTIGDLCTADDHIYAIILSKPSIGLPPNIAVLGPAYLTEPLLNKTANSKRILVSMIETLQKERNEHAMEKSGQDKRMEEIMTKVKGMIDESTQAECLIAENRLKEERAKADEKLAGELAKADQKLTGELAKADQKLAGELAKANKRIDEVEKRSSDDMAALQEQLQIAQSELQSSNDRADEMFYKLQEVDAVTMDTLEWISLGVRPGSNQHLPKLT